MFSYVVAFHTVTTVKYFLDTFSSVAWRSLSNSCGSQRSDGHGTIPFASWAFLAPWWLHFVTLSWHDFSSHTQTGATPSPADEPKMKINHLYPHCSQMQTEHVARSSSLPIVCCLEQLYIVLLIVILFGVLWATVIVLYCNHVVLTLRSVNQLQWGIVNCWSPTTSSQQHRRVPASFTTIFKNQKTSSVSNCSGF